MAENPLTLSPEDPAFIISFALLHIQSLLALVLNTVVMLVVIRYSDFRTPSHWIFASLALNNFLGGLVAPLYMSTFLLGPGYSWAAACSTKELLLLLTILADFTHIIFIFVERLITLRDPLTYHTLLTSRRVLTGLALLWLYIIVAVIAGFWGLGNINHDEKIPCLLDYTLRKDAYHIAMAHIYIYLTIFVVLQTGLAYTSCKAWKPIVHHSSQSSGNQSQHEAIQRLKSQRRLTRTMFLMGTLFILGFVSIPLVNIITSKHETLWSLRINLLSKNILCIHTWLNPFLFAMADSYFKRSLLQLMPLCLKVRLRNADGELNLRPRSGTVTTVI